MASQTARMIVDLIASGAGPNEVREAINTGLFETSMDCMDDYKQVVGDRFFDEAADVVTKGAKAAMPMTSVKKEKLARAPKDAQAKRQNDELLATGQHAAGGIEPATQFRGNGVGANGWMNPPEGKTTPRPYGGDRRPNRAGGPEFPFDQGTVPNGSGV